MTPALLCLSLRSLARVALAALLALAFLCQGIGAPFEKDEEARPAGLIRDVAQHGEWLVPRDDYGEPSRKPPLLYWLAALVVEAGGGSLDEARVRVVPLLAAVALAVEAMLFAGACLGETGGWLAFAFLLGIYGFASRAAHLRTDMLFSLFLFAAWSVLYPQLEGASTRARACLAGLLLGLAILTKGPLALVLYGLAIGIYLALEGRNPLAPLHRAWPWQLLGVAVAVAACWYVPAFLHWGRGLFAIQLGEENLGHFLPRLLGGTGEAARPFYYVGVRMAGAAMPLSLYLPALGAALLGSRFNAPARRPMLYQLSIVLAVLALFSLASSKRDIYMLPALPSLAILFAGLFMSVPVAEPAAGGLTGRLWSAADVALAAGGLALVALGVSSSFGAAPLGAITARMQSSDATYAALLMDGIANLRWRFLAFICAAGAASLVIAVGLVRRRPVWVAVAVATFSMAGVSLWIGELRPELVRQRTLKFFAAEVSRTVGEGRLCVLGGQNYEFSFYWGRGVPVCGPELYGDVVTDGQLYILASRDELTSLEPARRHGLKELLRSRTPGHTLMVLLESDRAKPAAGTEPGRSVSPLRDAPARIFSQPKTAARPPRI